MRSRKEEESTEIATSLQREVALSAALRQRRLRVLEEDLSRRAVAEAEEARQYELAIQAQEVR